ncbi:MAG: hypothetical protein ACP5N1_03050 [Candidatus Woesearchaeota archaeon]
MKNRMMGLYLTAIVLGTSISVGSNNNPYIGLTGSMQQVETKNTPCISDDRVKKVVLQMRTTRIQKSKGNYMLEINPKSAENPISQFAGQFTVYVISPEADKPRIAIFNRLDNNPEKWYNVTSIDNHCGCSDQGINLNTGKKLSQEESQINFNNAISKMERLLDEK